MNTGLSNLLSRAGEKLRAQFRLERPEASSEGKDSGPFVPGERYGQRWQMFEDSQGRSYILADELPSGLWLALAVSPVPELKVFSSANLKRMHLIGQVCFGT